MRTLFFYKTLFFHPDIKIYITLFGQVITKLHTRTYTKLEHMTLCIYILEQVIILL